ncbi:MAG: tRNA (N6-threonylcarbamoyladenosine(37)-N6)-methyltransferase TrmO [Methanosarcinaceae archaeon]
MENITYSPIGIIHSSFKNPDDTPIQAIFSNGAKGKVEVYPKYAAGLKNIGEFSHLILIYHFHLVKSYSLISKPFMENTEKGVFSIRHPKRPNPIGVSIVKLDDVKENILKISDVDIINGTPLLDIKPLIHQFDNRESIKSGWVDNQPIDETKEKTPRTLRDS